MKLKEGLYYNSKFNQVMEVVAIVKVGKSNVVIFDFGFGRDSVSFKKTNLIPVDHIVYLGKV